MMYGIISLFLLLQVGICDWIQKIDPHGNLKYQQLVDSLDFMTDTTVFKREEDDTLNSLVLAVYDSGILTDTLYEIASDDTQINTLINLTSSLLKGDSALSSIDFGGLNISINTTDLLGQVMDSGIIASTASYLLINETNRDYLADFTGGLLGKNVWVAKLLNELGAGKDLTIDLIADLIKNTPNLNPKYNSSAPEANEKVVNTFKRDDLEWLDEVFKATDLSDFLDIVLKDNEGSAQQFFGNLINGIFESSFFSTTLTSVLNSVNDTGIAGPLIMEIAQNSTILSMFPKLAAGLYNNGALNIDLNKYYEQAKREAILSDALQSLLTNPTWEPPVGKLLMRMENNGVFKDIQVALYGPDN